MVGYVWRCARGESRERTIVDLLPEMPNLIPALSDENAEQVFNIFFTIKNESNNISEEKIIDIADQAAASTSVRLSHEEVFGDIRRAINA